MIDVKDNWRILLLVALCIVAALALFGPLGASGPDIDLEQNDSEVEQFEDEDIFSDPTNLQYGLELSGGARIRGQLVGMTAEEVGLEEGDTTVVTETLTEELGLSPVDIRVREGPEQDTVEVFDGNVTEQQVADALQVAGFDVEEDDVSTGVTDATIDEAVETLTDRLDQTGLGGTQVATSSAVTGDTFIVAEAPGIGLQQLTDIVTEAGRVQILAAYPDSDGELEVTEAASGPDIAGVDPAQREDAQGPNRVPITLEPGSLRALRI